MALAIPTILPLALSSSSCDNHAWSIGSLIVLLIGGVIIGLLGKFLAPGSRDSIPLWLTVLCGIVGILLGNWLYVDVFGGKCATSGVDWLRHIVQIITAAVLVMIAASVTGRSRRV
ncbi:MAG TPA: hypothetical protein VFI21_02695 [Nocardioides sp.]|jgi:uncharacterized membrane protein YeaQ/YmgE (transglycosylase-associated protein family)|nr:hypothetical protein [Nocardioides sp.]